MTWITCIAIAWALAPASTHACSIPVYEYGLRNWPADAYQLFVFHDGPLSADQKQALDVLDPQQNPVTRDANIELTQVDLADNPPLPLQAIWDEQQDAQPPWIVAHYPHELFEAPQLAWAGPLTPSAARSLIDSPARRTIASRILSGQAAVWVLLESGQAEADDKAAALLKEQLDMLSQELIEGALPLGVPPTPDSDPDKVEHPEFSILRLSRDNAEEAVFIQTLLRSEPDLSTLEGPMVFPFFARGRLLYALINAGINKHTISEAAAFMVEGCSCLVKEQNPGLDMLMAVDWETGTMAAASENGTSASDKADRQASATALTDSAVTSTGDPARMADESDSKVNRSLLWTAIGLSAFMVSMTLVLLFKKQQHATS
jgi:hypothetical protein